jgi:hypothetical protein
MLFSFNQVQRQTELGEAEQLGFMEGISNMLAFKLL